MKEERKIVIPSLLGEPSDKIFKLVGTKSQVWPKFFSDGSPNFIVKICRECVPSAFWHQTRIECTSIETEKVQRLQKT